MQPIDNMILEALSRSAAHPPGLTYYMCPSGAALAPDGRTYYAKYSRLFF